MVAGARPEVCCGRAGLELEVAMNDTQSAVYPSLKGRVVLITGGATGIGESLVRHFARQGARVAFLDIQDEAAVALQE